MLEPRRSSRGPWRWLAALVLTSGVLFGGAMTPLAGQETAAPATEPAEPQEAAPATKPAEPREAAPAAEPAELQEADEPEAEAEVTGEDRPDRERRPERRQRRKDAQVVVGSSLVIEEDETSNDVVVMGGSLTVLGEVYGDAAAIGGSLVISGRVTGDVSAVGGSITLTPGAEVMGSALSFGGSVVREEGAVIHGEVVEVTSPGVHWAMWPRFLSWGGHRGSWFPHSPFDWALSQVWRIFGLIVLFLLACLALLLGRTPIDRIGRRIESEPWKTGLVGVASQILFVPLLILVCVVLAISIIGIPFLFLVPFALLALVIVIFFGYVGVALKLGDLLRGRFDWSIKSPYVLLLVGILALQVWTLIGHMLDFDGPALRVFAGLFMLFGFFVCYVAWTLATGGAILTRFGTAESWARKPAAPPPTPPAAQLEAPAAPPAADRTPGSESGADEPWEPEIDAEEERE